MSYARFPNPEEVEIAFDYLIASHEVKRRWEPWELSMEPSKVPAM